MAMNESTFDIQSQLMGNSLDSGPLSSYQQIKIKSEVIAFLPDKVSNGNHNSVDITSKLPECNHFFRDFLVNWVQH